MSCQHLPAHRPGYVEAPWACWRLVAGLRARPFLQVSGSGRARLLLGAALFVIPSIVAPLFASVRPRLVDLDGGTDWHQSAIGERPHGLEGARGDR